MASVAAAKIDAREGATSPVRSSLPSLCLGAALQHNKADALNHKVQGEWINISAGQFVDRVRHVALGLVSLGIKAGDRVALLSENRPEWSITDLAILSLGAVNVPIYTTQAVDQVEYILSDSGARALFVSGRKVFKHARAALENLSLPLKLIFFDEEGAEDVRAEETSTPSGLPRRGPPAVPVTGAITLADLEATGAERDARQPRAFADILNTVRADDLATIIYTSGNDR